MAGANLSIDVKITGPDTLARIDAAMDDTADLVARVGSYLTGVTRDRFDSQTGPDGSAWQPLQPRYQRRKKQNKDKILTLRGYLRGQLVSQVVGGKSVEVGSNLVYAAVHQFGGTIKPKSGKLLAFRGHVAKSVTIPARPYLGLSDADQNELVERTLDWLRTSGGLK